MKKLFEKFKHWFKNWKPIHLCWWFEKYGWKIPKYLIGDPDSEGPSGPGTVVDDDTIGTIVWGNLDNVKVDDNNGATAVGTAISHYLKATNFGFSIPGGATIDGILVEIKQRDLGQNALENSIKIVKGDAISGDEKKTGANLPDQYEYVSYGGALDLWGETWETSDINNSNFGVGFSVVGGNVANVAYIRITVYFTEAAPGRSFGQII